VNFLLRSIPQGLSCIKVAEGKLTFGCCNERWELTDVCASDFEMILCTGQIYTDFRTVLVVVVSNNGRFHGNGNI